jgi:hypothetical protein
MKLFTLSGIGCGRAFAEPSRMRAMPFAKDVHFQCCADSFKRGT